MTKYNRADVMLVLFPDSNLRTAKRRPALVVQADDLNAGLSQTIVAMITSNMARADHPSRIKVELNTPAGRRSGLKSDSVIMADNLATILLHEVDRKIGAWTENAPLDAALRRTLAL